MCFCPIDNRVNTLPANASGFGLLLKAGLIGPSADCCRYTTSKSSSHPKGVGFADPLSGTPNKFALLLRKKNITLIFMSVIDTYNLYSSSIKKNTFEKSDFSNNFVH